MNPQSTDNSIDFRQRLMQALRDELDARGGSERVEGTHRHRFTVISPRFTGMGQLDRQDLVWEVINRTLTDEEILQITVVLPFAPDEVGNYAEAMELEKESPADTQV